MKTKKKRVSKTLSDVWEEERVGGRRRCSLEGDHVLILAEGNVKDEGWGEKARVRGGLPETSGLGWWVWGA